MSEKFTDRARKVMQFTNQEAQRLNHEYIGTEHILLGLVREGSGVAAAVLKNLLKRDDPLRAIRLEVAKIVTEGPSFITRMVTMGKMPQTPRSKKVIKYAIEESRNFKHNYVGAEHLLLGLLREQEGVAAQVLMNLGLNVEAVRAEVLSLLGAAEVATRVTVEQERPMSKTKVRYVIDGEELSSVPEVRLRLWHTASESIVLQALRSSDGDWRNVVMLRPDGSLYRVNCVAVPGLNLDGQGRIRLEE